MCRRSEESTNTNVLQPDTEGVQLPFHSDMKKLSGTSETKGSEVDPYSLYNFKTSNCSDSPILLSVDIDGITVSMELDTGASKTVMSQETFEKLWKDNDREIPHLETEFENLQ